MQIENHGGDAFLLWVWKATGGTFLGWVIGLNPAMLLLIYLMGCDLVAGFLSAFVRRRVRSQPFWRGTAKKAITLILVFAVDGVGRHADIITAGIVKPVSLGLPLAGWYCIHEVISILEIVRRLGIDEPPFLSPTLRSLRKAITPGEKTDPKDID